ncbi:MAG: helix-turn-helix domain-containing protein, partial [bacterium]
MDFREKLKRLREQHELGQAELAGKARLSTNKIQRYEQSGQKPKGEDTLALARALGVTADYLLDDDLPYPPPEEHLSEKVAIIQRLEGLIAALQSQERGDRDDPGRADRPDVVHLPVFKLGAGFDVQFDAAGAARGEQVRDLYVTGLQDARCFAAELYG